MDKKKYEVSLESLTWKADHSEFKFNSTEEIRPPSNPIDIVKGQDEAKKSIKMAIELRQNVILLGPAGCGKSLLAKTVAEEFSKHNQNQIGLYDQVLVRNLENEYEPEVLSLPTPKGKEFAHDFKIFMRHVRDGAQISVNKRKQNPLDQMVRGSKYTIFSTTTYVGTYRQLLESASRQTKCKIVSNSDELIRMDPNSILDIPLLIDGNDTYSLREVYSNCNFEEQRNNTQNNFYMDAIMQKYRPHPKVMKYLEDAIKEYNENPDPESKSLFDMEGPHIKRLREEKYMVNLIVNNSETEGVPVEYIENPSLQNIMGEAGHDAYNMRPMHMRVKAGKLHKANGGIVIIDELITVFQDHAMRNYLLTVLNDKKGRVGGGHGLSGGGTSAGIETKPVDADDIIIGCANEDILNLMDDKIARRFQHKVKFQATMENNLENRLSYAEFISYEINKYNEDPSNQIKLCHYSPSGVAAVVEWGMRFAQRDSHGKKKITNILAPISGLIKQAALIAGRQGCSLVDMIHVEEARKEALLLSSQMQRNYMTYLNEGFISINTDGEQIGTINGLVVMRDEFGAYSFGLPAKLIATASPGKGYFENIEKEAGLSGKIMTKAHEILKNYFNKKFNSYLMDNATLSVSHAQSYNSVEGDSASIVTTIVLKSALANLPIDQSLAMTGSMNEFGEVQPIGGANEKIEGFYDVCKHKKLTGKQGVIIPEGNVQDLLLKKEILEDVKAGNFHIYSVKYIDEVVELTFNKPASEVYDTITKRLTGWGEENAKKS